MKLSEQIAEYEASEFWPMDRALAEALIARVRELEGALENLVPREPTEEMLDAARHAVIMHQTNNAMTNRDVRRLHAEIYRAMLAAQKEGE